MNPAPTLSQLITDWLQYKNSPITITKSKLWLELSWVRLELVERSVYFGTIIDDHPAFIFPPNSTYEDDLLPSDPEFFTKLEIHINNIMNSLSPPHSNNRGKAPYPYE